MTDITLSTTGFDVLADYDVYSEYAKPCIEEILRRAYLNNELGVRILSTDCISRWLLSIDDNAYSTTEYGEKPFSNMALALDHVQRVGQWAFEEQEISAIYMPSVKDIGTGAFYDAEICNPAETNAFRDLKTIGQVAFENAKLSKYAVCDLMRNVEHIGGGAFKNAEMYDTVGVVANNLTCIEQIAFENTMMYISSFNAPRLKTIGVEAFNNSYTIENLVMPNVETIEARAFNLAYYIGETMATRHEHLTSFYASSFKCMNVSKEWRAEHRDGIVFDFPSVLVIGGMNEYECALTGQRYMISYKLPSLSSMSYVDCGFNNDLKLKTLDFSDNAFIALSASYDDLRIRTAYNIAKTTEILIDNLPDFFYTTSELDERGYKVINGLALVNSLTGRIEVKYIGDRRNPVYEERQAGSYKTLSGTYVPVLDFLTVTTTSKCNAHTVCTDAFSKCNNLQSVNLASVKTVQSYAFWQANNLTSICLPNATNISADAFLDCPSLKELYVFQFNYDEIVENLSYWLDTSKLTSDLSVWGNDNYGNTPSYVLKHD